MENGVTKDDLRQFGMVMKEDIRLMLEKLQEKREENIDPEWLKSRRVRRLLDMSAASLQNLRIEGKVRYKKILGSYYYNRTDLKNLFKD